METLNAWIRGVVTVLLVLGVGAWLFVVSLKLGTVPVVDSAGNVILDEYQRAKDILLVVLPLVTTAMGYWFGAQGKDKAEDRADKAVEEKAAVLAATGDPALLERVRAKYGEALGVPSGPERTTK